MAYDEQTLDLSSDSAFENDTHSLFPSCYVDGGELSRLCPPHTIELLHMCSTIKEPLAKGKTHKMAIRNQGAQTTQTKSAGASQLTRGRAPRGLHGASRSLFVQLCLPHLGSSQPVLSSHLASCEGAAPSLPRSTGWKSLDVFAPTHGSCHT